MKLNPFGVGLAFYNNWQTDEEFIMLSCELFYREGGICITMGLCGFGFALWYDVSSLF